MAGYWLIRGSEIKDEKALKEYGELWGGIAARYGAVVIAGRGRIDTREGQHYPRQLFIRFDNYEQAVACYENPEYQKAKEVALAAYDRELSIVEG